MGVEGFRLLKGGAVVNVLINQSYRLVLFEYIFAHFAVFLCKMAIIACHQTVIPFCAIIKFDKCKIRNSPIFSFFDVLGVAK